MVIDVLRASTTILESLANGADAVLPCASVAEAENLACKFQRSRILLGGERHGQLIPGFDLDNSPLAYRRNVVAGRKIVFTTTNGTQALAAAASSERILIGAFVNLQAIVADLRTDPRPVHCVCAGTDGSITAEDVLFAGLLSRRLIDERGLTLEDCPVSTELAIRLADGYPAASQLREVLFRSQGGRNLLDLGFTADVELAAQIDRHAFVAEWDRQTGEIRIA